LSIIDLSENGAQPMSDPELGLDLVFNGCIYNYKELRTELSAQGYRFFSTSDTEVILKAWHAWGPTCVERFNGMFAFGLWEQNTQRLFLVRDRLGIKPLYLAESHSGLRFASSLPALLATGHVDTTLDPEALHYYMTFHAVVPAPWTLFKGIRKLPPATVATIYPDGRREDHTFWQLDMERDPDDAGLTDADWMVRLETGLLTAVKRRLVADVPVGVLLSGGLDSSLIVGLLARLGQMESGLETFSVGFESVGGEQGDEFHYSDIIANHFGTRHHQIRVPSTKLLETLPATIGAMSEPMVSHDNVGFYLLSQEVAKHVKVVQSGQGADEVFAGYHWYPPMQESRAPVTDYAAHFFDRPHTDMAEVLQPEWLSRDFSHAFVTERFAQPGAATAVDQALRLDTTVMLVDDPVKRVDNMTMAWGLEARVPFLDHELVELAGRMPPELKLRDGGKGILKAVARRHIPHAVIDRPKGYFPVPALKYLEGPYLAMVRDALTSRRAQERGLYQNDYVNRLLADPRAHLTPLRGSKLWQLGVLELWLQQQGV
jgi:asparagine synthase (glutamine-hydrolysing)